MFGALGMRRWLPVYYWAHRECSGVTLANVWRTVNAQANIWRTLNALVLACVLIGAQRMLKCYAGYCLAHSECTGVTLAIILRTRNALVCGCVLFGAQRMLRCYAG